MSKNQPMRRSPLPLMIGALVLLIAGAVVLNLIGARSSPRPTAPAVGRADPNDAAQVALGREVYVAQCASCHGADLQGQQNWQEPLPDGGRLAPPHDASGHTWHHPDELLFAITKSGGQSVSPAGYRNYMPAFGGVLSDAQIWAVLAYIKSRWPAEIRMAQEQVNQQAE